MGWKDGKYYADSQYGMAGDIGNWIAGQYRGSTNPANRSGHMNSMVTGNRNVTGVLDREGTLMNRANAMPKDVLPAPRQKPVTSLPSLDTAPVTKINAPSVKVQKPKVLTRAGASAVADAYNQDALRMSVDSPANRGVGYNTALGGYNPEAMDNIYSGTYDAQAGVPQYNADGMNVNNVYQPNAPVQAQQLPDLNTLQQTQQPSSSIGSWFNGSMSTPNGMSKADFQALPIEQQAKLMGGKTGWETLGSTMSGIGSMAGGLAGVYGAYANAKYQKDQTNMQKAMIRGDEANKSAFAKAAGGTYQSSGV